MIEIDGYKVIPLRRYPNDKNSHSVYMKQHFIRVMDPNKPRGRTLFLLNVPPYVTEESLKISFKKIGAIISVTFAEKPGKDETNKWSQNVKEFSNKEARFKFKVAYVVFKTNSSVERALAITSLDLFNEATGESTIQSGMQLWHAHYQKKWLDTSKTREYIDKYMASYDERESAAIEKNTEVDANGWVTVGKHGKNSGFEQKDSVINKLEQKMEKGKKNKELTNFYTFQIRESKMKDILELKKKFEEDKRKIESLKRARRFRPF